MLIGFSHPQEPLDSGAHTQLSPSLAERKPLVRLLGPPEIWKLLPLPQDHVIGPRGPDGEEKRGVKVIHLTVLAGSSVNTSVD